MRAWRGLHYDDGRFLFRFLEWHLIADLLNGIPSSRMFMKRLGRTGLRRHCKKPDADIDALADALRDAERWRAVSLVDAIAPLRRVRRLCAEWMRINIDAKRLARPHVRALALLVNHRILDLVEEHFATADDGPRRRWRGVLDDVVRAQGRPSGTPVGRALAPAYGLERFARTHPSPMATQSSQSRYELARDTGRTKLAYEEWMDQVVIPLSQDDPFQHIFRAGQGNLPNARRVDEGVTYCTAEERWSRNLQIRGGMILDADGEPFHTGEMSTHFSGRGWAIYVVDFSDEFYSDSHVLGRFHHSSFLCGAPVKAAGELAVDRGRLVALTNKTGHYRAGADELARALDLLGRSGVDLTRVATADCFVDRHRWVAGDQALRARGAVGSVAGTVAAPARVEG